MLPVSRLIWCPMSDCGPRAAGGDVPGRAEGTAGPPKGGAAGGAAGEAGAHPGGEAAQEAAAARAAGHHRAPQERAGTGCCHQVRGNVRLWLDHGYKKMWAEAHTVHTHTQILSSSSSPCIKYMNIYITQYIYTQNIQSTYTIQTTHTTNKLLQASWKGPKLSKKDQPVLFCTFLQIVPLLWIIIFKGLSINMLIFKDQIVLGPSAVWT